VFVDDMSLIAGGAAFSRIARSIRFSTGSAPSANDPITWELYGTNDAILSGDNSAGQGENWSFIASGLTGLPAERSTLGQVLAFTNSTPYSAYRIVFPDLKDVGGASAMQLGDVALFESTNGTGPNLLSMANLVRAIQLPTAEANSPLGGAAEAAIDGVPMTTYTNFGKENSGLIVTPNQAESTVTSFVITTAAADPSSDPASYALYGTNQPVTSLNFSQGDQETWTLIDSGPLTLPDTRLTPTTITLNNSTSYKSYRLIFPSLKPTGAVTDSLKIGDVQFFGIPNPGQFAVPEPGTLALAAWGLAAGANGSMRRRKWRAHWGQQQ
jgi:hypothetical protein